MKALRVGLTLVRHGETEYNKAGLLQGQAVDSSLSEAGQQQAAAAGSYLRDVGFSNVFSSDMRRARQVRPGLQQDFMHWFFVIPSMTIKHVFTTQS